jgi:hypothetical protein
MHYTKINRKNKNKKRLKSRKIRGGTSFNEPVNFGTLPSSSFYPFNSYNASDPLMETIDTRQILGGKSRKRVPRRNRTKRSKRKRDSIRRKIKGGYNNIPLNPYPFNNVEFLPKISTDTNMNVAIA